jgi:hypothetical protein
MSCGTGWTTLKTTAATWTTITPYIAACPDIALSNSSVADGASISTIVGTFSMTDGFGTYTYTLDSQTPGVYFEIIGNDLVVYAPPNRASNPTVTVTVSADNGLALDPVVHAFLITVTGGAAGDGTVNVDEDGNPIAFGVIF